MIKRIHCKNWSLFYNHRVFSLKIFALAFFCPLLLSSQPISTLVSNKSISESNFDYRNLSWLAAFDSIHNCLKQRYPYTEWKAINWDEKLIVSRPLIANAQRLNDTVLFTEVLFEYLYGIPDGHIKMHGNIDGFKKHKAIGSYGFNMMPITDGRVVITSIPEQSPAYIAGMRCGDEVLRWDGNHIDSIPEYELWNYFRNYSTLEGRLLSRYLMLSRDSIGAQAEVVYKSSVSSSTDTLLLEAFNDDNELYVSGIFNTASPDFLDTCVFYKIRESGFGYLRLSVEDSEAMTFEDMLEDEMFLAVVDAINYFNDNEVEQLIVDLRFNLGGNDLLAAVLMGCFYDSPAFYEHITATYDDNYEILYTLVTEPLSPQFTGKISVIVDQNCISTGEGIAMMFQRLENAKVISFHGTNGSFGIVDHDEILMPAGLLISFPQARSLNEQLVIQLDSDSSLSGGVVPDIRIPLTVEQVRKQYEQNIDVQLEYIESYMLGVKDYIIDRSCIAYPNPCADYVFFKLDQEMKLDGLFSLYNHEGKLILQENLSRLNHGGVFKLNISGLSSGIYIYEILHAKSIYKGKIIVIH